jgi:glutathione S-transferase
MTALPAPGAPLSLLTFPPMIDSELSRFVLWRYQIPYREEPHIFGWASVLTLLRGGNGRIPLLHGSGLRLTGPRAIVDHFEGTCPLDRKLLPARQPLRTRVEADWDRFNGELAAHTAVVAYYHLLPHRDIMIEPFSRGVPPREAAVVESRYPLLRRLFTLLLRLSPGKAADALARIRMTFERTDARLADGRPYMTGDALTLSDLSLATAAAPLLLPEGYGSPIPPLERMPAEMRAIVDEMRQHATARFVERIYAIRRPQPQPD